MRTFRRLIRDGSASGPRRAPAGLVVIVPVVQVGVMRMRMHERCVVVRMGVRFAAIPFEIVRMLMVRVVDMQVRVVHRLVRVGVFVVLGDVQPHTERHERPRDPEGDAGRVAQ